MNLVHGRRTVVVLLAGLLVAAGPAFGQGIINPFGQPQIVIGSQPIYYVWVDQTGWHVRWSTPFPQAFSGFLTSNGLISGVCGAGGGWPSGLSLTGAQRAVFSTPARSGIGGFDFRTSGSTVTFNLNVHGVQLPGWLVFIGRSLVGPSFRSFTLSATPSFLQQPCREPHLSDVDRPVTYR